MSNSPQVTFCLIRVSTTEHDSWALRNIWGHFPDAKTILIGDGAGIFSEADRNYHQLITTTSLKVALKNPTPHLIFLRSDVIIKGSFQPPTNIGGRATTFGRFDGGLIGFNNLGLLGELKTFDFFEGEIEGEKIIERTHHRLPHIDFDDSAIVYSTHPLTDSLKRPHIVYTRLATLIFPC